MERQFNGNDNDNGNGNSGLTPWRASYVELALPSFSRQGYDYASLFEPMLVAW